MQDSPKISIISPSKNTGRFLRETIDSILKQTFTNWEHIVVDSCSTDETLNILKENPHIRWISENDSGPDEAFNKGLKMAKGEYIMLCCISDGYLNNNWFKNCVEILDHDPEISLVWGIDQNMLEDGTLDKIVYNSWFESPPPSGKDFIYYWLKNETLFHERNMCVRKNVMKDCFPVVDLNMTNQISGFMEFFYYFNAKGYLPYFIPNLAAYGRYHGDALAKRQNEKGEMSNHFNSYQNKIRQYRKKIIMGEIKHNYRDGFGGILPDQFDRKRYIRQIGIQKAKKIMASIKIKIASVIERLLERHKRIINP